MIRRALGLALLAVVVIADVPAAQQRTDLSAALALERRGRHREAADLFASALETSPGALQALFGLERALRKLGALERIMPFLDTAVVLNPGQHTVRSLQLRVLVALGQGDAARAAAERWIDLVPRLEDPYREWSFALAQHGDVQQARLVLQRGNRVLGGVALLQELAQMDVVGGDWAQATRHWHASARAVEIVGAAAGLSLSQAPPSARDVVLNVLLREFGDATARQIAADVLVSWDRPGEGWALLDHALPAAPDRAARVLQRFAERARRSATPEAYRVRGLALERLATMLDGAAAQQARIDAARAFADAGDRADAERMLGKIARDTAQAPAAAGGTMTTLITVLVDAGRIEDAERRLAEWRGRLAVDDVATLRDRLAWGWLRRGDLESAARVLDHDSSLATAAVRGWVALYRGALGEAGDRFREAGPYTGSREDATARTGMLALIQRIEVDHAPAVGDALLTLARGDSAAAIDHLTVVARSLPAVKGRSDLLHLAGRVAVQLNDPRAELLLEEAVAVDAIGPVAPAAELMLAELAVRDGRNQAAIARLERLILAFPDSAVIPQARRLLDQVRGAIPRS
ncbi:MAG TPA: hypothetical protein VGA37_14005 [Gemmatimonadales bacterium]